MASLLDEDIPSCDHITQLHGRMGPATFQWNAEDAPEAVSELPIRATEEFLLSTVMPQDQLGFPPVSQENQFANMSSHSDRFIDVEQQTRHKAEQNPDTDVVVYECKWDEQGNPCGQWIEGNAKEIRTHLRKLHAVNGQTKDQIRCKWSNCTETLKYGSIPRHIMTHLKVTFRCSTCQQSFSREDCIQHHLRTTDKCKQSDAITVHGPGARRIVPPNP
ncbi:hypothetical protein SCLCIDRAFT_1213736 [Scleroderma citrinum Foug A]|uniref:C2H2-type domain-containing protein n=1 Tax=Scleroderma citrinum Foug A TaxID=1036808 RepID=A0A0C3DTI4_9AGAM|nr:hypothetical protein SCLCIDRAFT_1213736 [Scleroderma citrinum Foug A]